MRFFSELGHQFDNIVQVDAKATEPLKKVEMLEGVRGAEVFIPFRVPVYQDWILREIDNKIKFKGR